MKKIVLSFLLVLFFVPLILKAETEVYIYPVATSKASYGSGDVIKGQFTIHNLLSERQPDVFYEIGISSGDKFQEAIIIERKKFDPLFLEAKSKRIITYDYTVPNTIEGRAFVFVNAYSAEGKLLALGHAPILVTKNNMFVTKERILPIDVYLQDNILGRSEFAKINRFYPDQEVAIEMLFPQIKSEANVTASIKSTQVNSNEEIILDPYNFAISSEDQKYINIPLPKIIVPGTYEIDVIFESDTVFVPSFNFLYTVIGSSFTFTQMEASALSFKKNKEIEITSEYTIPLAFSDEEYQLITEPLKNVTATIKVVNEKEETVFEETEQFDLTQSNKIIFKNRALVSAQSISAVIKVFDAENNLINEYKSDFPSEEQVRSWYDSESINWTSVLFGFVTLVLVIGGLALYRKFHNKNGGMSIPTVSLIIIGSFLLGFGSYQTVVEASEVEQGTILTNGGTFTGFLNEIFYSPLPQEVRSYDPGEAFDIFASIGVHGNLGQSASFKAYTQSPYCNPITEVCDWYQEEQIPPVELYWQLSSLEPRIQYCSDGIRNLHDWFVCEGWQVLGYDGSCSNCNIILSTFIQTYAWSSARSLMTQVDWLGSGLLTGSDYLPATKEFETDVTAIFNSIHTGIISHKSHDYDENIDEYSSPYIPIGYMFQMFSHKFEWTINPNLGTRSISSSAHNKFLHFKYFYPEEAFVPERTETYRKDLYSSDLNLINLVKNTIIEHNLPGANIVSNFNFSDTEAIYQADYNSPEFNQALGAVLDFLYELSTSVHEITYNMSSLIKTQQDINSDSSSPYYNSAYVSRSYDIQKSNTLKMPMDGGVYKIFYYALLQQSRPIGEDDWFHDDKDVLISQTICVRGAGVCDDEEPILCPNLIVEGGPTYTQDEAGVIYENLVATNMVIDENGSCVVPVYICSEENEVGGACSTNNICGDSSPGTYSCTAEGWQCNITDTTVPVCPPTSVSCEGTPSFVNVTNGQQSVTFSSNVQSPPSPTYGYRWTNGTTILGASLGSGSTLTRPYAPNGQRDRTESVTISITDSESNSVANSSCSVTVLDTNICVENQGEACGCNNTGIVDCSGSCSVSSCGPEIVNFSFDPFIVNQGQQCDLILEVENAASCELRRDSTVFGPYLSPINITNASDIGLNPGTYSLYCTGTAEGATAQNLGSRKCVTNLSVGEN